MARGRRGVEVADRLHVPGGPTRGVGLGDAEIARGQDRFDIDAVAQGIADKLVHRHPYVFAGQDTPGGLSVCGG